MNSQPNGKKPPDPPERAGGPPEGAVSVARFEIFRQAFLRPDGTPDGPLPDFASDRDVLVGLYKALLFARAFDAKAIALQRTGRLGTYASSLGQEAVGTGVASAMHADDVLLPSFREHAAQLWRGVTATELFLYWGGDERGSDFAGPREDFPVSIPVGSQFPHAAGAGLAFQTRSEDRVAVVFGGDGSTSKGDFYEALNLCGAWRLPVVFVISNNQWAISVPRAAQTAAGTLAQKAVAAGVPGVQVDGNDVIAVRHAADTALRRARAGDGPTLIEALTYRLSDHTTADDASRYRDDADVSPHWPEEPVARLRTYLTDRFGWDKSSEETALSDARTAVEAAAEAYLATPPAPPEAMFEHLFAALPPGLADQYEQATAGGGEDA